MGRSPYCMSSLLCSLGVCSSLSSEISAQFCRTSELSSPLPLSCPARCWWLRGLCSLMSPFCFASSSTCLANSLKCDMLSLLKYDFCFPSQTAWKKVIIALKPFTWKKDRRGSNLKRSATHGSDHLPGDGNQNFQYQQQSDLLSYLPFRSSVVLWNISLCTFPEILRFSAFSWRLFVDMAISSENKKDLIH